MMSRHYIRRFRASLGDPAGSRRKADIIMVTGDKSASSMGHRIDALRVAARTLGADPHAEPSVRRMAESLRTSAEQEGNTELAAAARAVEDSAPATLADNLDALIAHVRRELTARNYQPLSILLVTADSSLSASLPAALTAAGHTVRTCASTATARQLVAEFNPAILIADHVLPSDDGRILICDLRSRSNTAAMPIVAITPQKAAGDKPPALVIEADAYFHKPIDPIEVAEFITSRFRRIHDHGIAARRDPVSGLLNRAAFTETVEPLLLASAKREEPLSLALIGLADGDRISNSCPDEMRDDLIRKLASVLSASLRSSDIVARWGLYEFAVALPGEDHFGMTCAMEKVLSQMNRHRMPLPDGKTLTVRACAGGSVVSAGQSFSDCTARIEGFLFQARFAPAAGTGANIVSDSLPQAGRTARIALFVGESTMERALSQMLETDRIEVVPIRDMATAMSQLTGSVFHMLIADDHVPGDAAMKLIQAVRQSEPLNRLQIILLAGNEEAVSRGLALGASDYVLTPVVAPTFVNRIRRNLSRHDNESKGGSQFTVMLVDTVVPPLLIAGTVLYQQTACNVLLALGPQEALSRFAETPPDCLIVNFDIPAAALNEFLDRLATLPRFKDIPVIAASARPDIASRITVKLPNLKGRIAHPYKPASFVEQIKSLVSLPAETGQAKAGRTPIETEIQRLLLRGH